MRGFTVTELMIVVAILAILTAIAVPGMRSLIQTQRVRTAAFDVYAGLTLARSEAVKRNASVTVTPVGGDWAKGWSAADSNGTVVAKQDAFSQITLDGPATVAFNSLGRLGGAASQFQVSTSELANDKWRCVKLDLSGRPVSSVGACP
jgi:type IV fimbrial biogenesis protein FimT